MPVATLLARSRHGYEQGLSGSKCCVDNRRWASNWPFSMDQSRMLCGGAKALSPSVAPWSRHGAGDLIDSQFHVLFS